ncbi:MAG: hypothetical protein IKZ67_08005, partial [Paludibacteraceae bacterium]|nr:hypothetical protein [Paludibacteraceae bacterium]
VAPVCENTEAYIEIDGASSSYEYVWDNGKTGSNITEVITPKANELDSFKVTCTDPSNGCQSRDSIAVGTKPYPIIALYDSTNTLITNKDITTCKDAKLKVTAKANNEPTSATTTYIWRTENDLSFAQDRAELSTTVSDEYTYIVTVNMNKCESYDTITTHYYPTPVVTIDGDRNTCPDKDAELFVSVTGGNSSSYTINWQAPTGVSFESKHANSNDTIIAKNLAYGQNYTFYASATGSNGCSAKSEPFTVGIWNSPTIKVEPDKSSVCAGESTTINAKLLTGTGSFTWQYNGKEEVGDKIEVTIQGPTPIHVIGTDENGCTNTADTTIGVLANPTLAITGDRDFCEGGQGTQLTLSGAKVYTIDDGRSFERTSTTATVDVNFKPDATKDYIITYQLGECTRKDTVTITVKSLPDLRINGETNGTATICEGDSIVLGATKGLTDYTWTVPTFNGTKINRTSDTLVIKTDVTHQAGQSFTIGVTAKENGCDNTAQYTVNINPQPVFSLVAKEAVCENGEVQLSVTQQTGAEDIQMLDWGALSSSKQARQITVNTTKAAGEKETYSVTATSNSQCAYTATAEVNIKANPNFTIEGKEICEKES